MLQDLIQMIQNETVYYCDIMYFGKGQKKKSTAIRQSVSFSGSPEMSRSVKRLKDILKDDGSEKQSLPIFFLYRNNQKINSTYYLLPSRTASLLHHKLKNNLLCSVQKIIRFGSLRKHQTKALKTISRLILSSSIRQLKALFFSKLHKKKQNHINKQRGANLIGSILSSKRKSYLSVPFNSHYAPRWALNLKTVYSERFMKELQKIKKYEKTIFFSQSTVQLKTVLEEEISRFKRAYSIMKIKQNMIPPFNNQLILLVLRNHIQAIMDINSEGEQLLRQMQHHQQKRKGLSQIEKDKKLVKFYEDLIAQFQGQQQKLLKWIIKEEEFTESEILIQNYIQSHRGEKEKMIQSRVRIFTIMRQLLKNLMEKIKPASEKGNNSFHIMGVTHIRSIIHQLDYKVYELSTVSEQIPQLQIFKRTLNFSMPQHNGYFSKIVDVIIQLHHKVNKLQKNKPGQIQKQLEQVEYECSIIQIRLSEFLQSLSSEHQSQVKPISYPLKIQNKSPPYFRKLHQLTATLSQHMVYIQNQTAQEINWVRSVLDVFFNLFSHSENLQSQWLKIQEKIITHDQQEIWIVLNQCIKAHEKQRKEYQQIMSEYEEKMKFFTSTLPQNQHFLENKLNQMQKRNVQLKMANKKLERQLENEGNQKFVFSQTNKEQDQVIKQLNRNIEITEKRSKVDKQRISVLEGENQQKKSIINNLNIEIRSIRKQENNTFKYEQKIQDLKSLLQKQRRQKQVLSVRVQQIRQDYKQSRIIESEKYEKMITQNLQLKQKNDYLQLTIKNHQSRIHDLQQSMEELELQLSDTKEEEKIASQDYENEIAEQINKNNVITKKLEEFQNQIEQLNRKIEEMNNQIKQITEKEEEMEHQLKICEQKQWKYKVIIQELKQEQWNKIDSTIMRDQLSKAHQELQKSYQIVQKLQKQIKRRQNLIYNLESVISEQTQKYTHNEQEWEFTEDKYHQEITSLREEIQNKNQTIWKYKKDHQSFQKHKYEKQTSAIHEEVNKKKLRTEVEIYQKENQELKTEIQNIKIQKSKLQKIQNQQTSKIQFLQDNGQIAYLKQKNESLEELVKIYKDQHLVLQAKVKQYRDTQKIVFEHQNFLKQKEKQMSILEQQLNEQKAYIKKLQIDYQKIDSNAGSSRITAQQIKKQKIYVEKINEWKNFSQQHAKVAGKKLQEVIHKIKLQNYDLKEHINNILLKKIVVQNFSEKEMIELIQENKFLAQQLNKILLQKEEISYILQEQPNPDFITECIFNILAHFTKIAQNSHQGKKIWEQLQNIRENYSGSEYFVQLEDFTKYNLEQNTIKSYVHELERHKQQLELLRNVFTSQQEKSQKTATTLNNISQH